MPKLLAHPLVMLAAAVLVVLFIVSLRQTAQKSEVASRNVAVMDQKIEEVSEELTEEKQELEYGASDLAREKLRRDDLLMQKPGEYVLQISDGRSATNTGPTHESISAWAAWKALLF